MSTDITNIPEGKLQIWTPKKDVTYITMEPGDDSIKESDIPFTQDDIEYIERKQIPYEESLPPDRELVMLGSLILAMPKDSKAMFERIENAGKPKPELILVPLTRWERIKTYLSLLNPFRGRNAKGKR